MDPDDGDNRLIQADLAVDGAPALDELSTR
jgi:hypothetical protein